MLLMVLSNEMAKMQPFMDMDCKVMLLQAGVYLYDELTAHFSDVYVLESDFRASGLDVKQSSHGDINLISHADWVELCAIHHPVVTVQ
ncbi:MAG: DsrH/TusB family sulfur metabolism protein [Pseudomonadota bacterium]